MLYNDFRGDRLSRLGFGCMRFASDPATGEIDQAKVNAMFRKALDGGVNYFDTAYPYLNGRSESAMSEALKDVPRDSYYLADKFPGHSLPGPVDNSALFNISLDRCRTDYFDYYLLHNITEWSVKIYEDPVYHILPDLLRLRGEGKIRHLGFSFHGGAELLEDYLTRHEGVFEFVQIQCNYLDWTLQNAKEKYDIITRHGLGVWIMEPLRGGKLAVLPGDASAALRPYDAGMSDAGWAFRFLQGLDNVKMILSGMNELFQVEDNLSSFALPRPLSREEEETLFSIAEGMKRGVPCTACRYCCDGCPAGLDIPMLIECYNDYRFAPAFTSGMRIDGLPEDRRPAACVGCGQCNHACPQGIDVSAVMSELAGLYASGPKWADAAAPRQKAILRDLHMG